eukprot:6186168-Pleurochrysis_carterae.AAC.4
MAAEREFTWSLASSCVQKVAGRSCLHDGCPSQMRVFKSQMRADVDMRGKIAWTSAFCENCDDPGDVPGGCTLAEYEALDMDKPDFGEHAVFSRCNGEPDSRQVDHRSEPYSGLLATLAVDPSSLDPAAADGGEDECVGAAGAALGSHRSYAVSAQPCADTQRTAVPARLDDDAEQHNR